MPEQLNFPDFSKFPQIVTELQLDSYRLRFQNGAPFASVLDRISQTWPFVFLHDTAHNDKGPEEIQFEVYISCHCNILQRTATRGVSINQLPSIQPTSSERYPRRIQFNLRHPPTAQERDNLTKETKSSFRLIDACACQSQSEARTH